MTTSGSTNFAISTNDIIDTAALEIGDKADGEVLSAERYAAMKFRLNTMVKALMKNGANLWAMSQATLFLARGTSQYSIGDTGTHCTNSYVKTTLAASAAGGATSITLTSVSGMSASDNIGIVLDSGAIHWTTISGAPAIPLTIASGLPSAASSGAIAYTYTTKVNRPQRIDGDSIYYRNSSNIDVPVAMISRVDYANQSSKTSLGKITQAFYDPQLTNGILRVWPAPDSSNDVLQFWYERPLQDFDAVNNNPDFPIEWAEALILGLADKMAPSSSLSLQERAMLQARASEELARVLAYDREPVSTFFQPCLER